MLWGGRGPQMPSGVGGLPGPCHFNGDWREYSQLVCCVNIIQHSICIFIHKQIHIFYTLRVSFAIPHMSNMFAHMSLACF